MSVRETPKAKEAGLRYVAMGPERSLRKLAAVLVAERGLDEGSTEWDKAVDSKFTVLGDWSAAHGWVARAAEYDDELNRERLAKLQAELVEEDAHAFEMVRAALRLRGREVSAEDPNLVRTMPDVSAAVKLLHDLAGDPLVERREITGKDGNPIQVETRTRMSIDRALEVLAEGEDGNGSREGGGAGDDSERGGGEVED